MELPRWKDGYPVRDGCVGVPGHQENCGDGQGDDLVLDGQAIGKAELDRIERLRKEFASELEVLAMETQAGRWKRIVRH